MTDDEVVKVLAGFVGATTCDVGQDGCLCRVRDYLTSYDAIAEVWHRASTTPIGGRRTLAEKAQVDLLGIHVNHELIDDWWQKSPREHAYALAKAISQSKGD